jgi:hypothetical protein
MKKPAQSSGSFQELWKQCYGKSITAEQAEEYEERLVSLLKLMIDFEQKEKVPP